MFSEEKVLFLSLAAILVQCTCIFKSIYVSVKTQEISTCISDHLIQVV